MNIFNRTFSLNQKLLWFLQLSLLSVVFVSFIITFAVFQSTITTDSWNEPKILYDYQPVDYGQDYSAQVIMSVSVLSVSSAVDSTSIRFQTLVQLPANWGAGNISFTSNTSFVLAAGSTFTPFSAGDAVPAVLSVVLSSTNTGTIFQYPFDQYEATALFGVLYDNLTIYDEIEEKGIGSRGEKFPSLRLIIYESVKYGWDYSFEELPLSASGLSDELSDTARFLRVTFRRSDVFRLYPFFMILAFWAITGAIWFWGISAVVFEKKAIEPPFVSYLMGLLFVLPAFRNTAPSSPPVGCLLDFAAFFWSILSVVIFAYAAWYKFTLLPLINKLRSGK